jgi:hypothetical protein
MKILLILNILIEGIFGVLFIFAPQFIPITIFNAPPDSLLYMARMYGFAALAIALLSWLVLNQFHIQEVLVTGLLILAVFHTGICIAQFLHSIDVSETAGAGVMHAVLAVGFWLGYFSER